MPRGGNRCKFRPVRYDFLEILCQFANDHHGAVPTHYGWWQLVRQHGYTLHWTSFREHSKKLEQDGYIAFQHNVIVINHSRWELLEPDTIPQKRLPLFASLPR